jgi:hypothetical protein
VGITFRSGPPTHLYEPSSGVQSKRLVILRSRSLRPKELNLNTLLDCSAEMVPPDNRLTPGSGYNRSGTSHFPLSAERNTASITAMLQMASSSGFGTSVFSRMARENSSA